MGQDRLTYTDAAEAVLTRHSKGAPMHYRRITELAISEGLIQPGGKTPEASMVASMTQEIKRRDRADSEQRFRVHGRHVWPGDPD